MAHRRAAPAMQRAANRAAVSPNNSLICQRNGAVIGRVRRKTLFSLGMGVVQNWRAWLASRGSEGRSFSSPAPGANAAVARLARQHGRLSIADRGTARAGRAADTSSPHHHNSTLDCHERYVWRGESPDRYFTSHHVLTHPSQAERAAAAEARTSKPSTAVAADEGTTTPMLEASLMVRPNPRDTQALATGITCSAT